MKLAVINCEHWRPGVCAAGHNGGRASVGLCLGCPHRVGEGPALTGRTVDAGKPLTLAQVAHGAAGIARAIVGIDRASDETIAARKATCATCPHNTGGLVVRCRLCGCGLAAKTKLAGERCPAGKW